VPIQRAIRKDWMTQLLKAAKSAKDPELQNFFDALHFYHFGDGTASEKQAALDSALDLIREGKAPRSNYQYVNPSEYWAVNGERIMSGRSEVPNTVVGRIKQWLKEFWEKIKSAIPGVRSDSPIINALNSLMKGDGKYKTDEMLSSQEGPFAAIRRKVRGEEVPADSEGLLHPTAEQVAKGEDIITTDAAAKKRYEAEKLPEAIYKFKNSLSRENYEKLVKNFQNVWRPWQNAYNQLDFAGRLKLSGPNANDPWTIMLSMDSVADALKNEHVEPIKREIARAIADYAREKGISPERAYETVDHMLFARMADLRRDELFRRYVPLRESGNTNFPDGTTSTVNPAVIRNQLYKKAATLLGDQRIPKNEKLAMLDSVRIHLDNIANDARNHDPLGHSFHPGRLEGGSLRDDSGRPIPMSTNWDASIYSPAAYSDPHTYTAPILRVMNDDLKKYPALQQVFDAHAKANEIIKGLKRMGGAWTDYVDDAVHLLNWEDKYAPLMRDMGDMDPLSLEGTRNAGHVSGIVTGFGGGKHVATGALGQTMVNLDRAALEASRGGLTQRVANLIDTNAIQGLGHFDTVIPASDIYMSALDGRNLGIEHMGGNTIILTRPNGDKAVYKIDNQDFLDGLRRERKTPNIVTRAATKTLGAVASQFTHLRFAFMPWNFLKHSLMNAHVMMMTERFGMGPEYIGNLLSHAASLDGFSMFNVAKLLRNGEFDEVNSRALNNPFIKDAAEWYSRGGRASYADIDTIANSGSRLLSRVKENKFTEAKDALGMVMNQWNDSWDLLSRVTAYGMFKRQYLDSLGYGDAVDTHGLDSPEAKDIYNEASARAVDKAKGLANFSLYGEKGRSIGSWYMFFRPEITTKVAIMDALSPLFTSKQNWVSKKLLPQDRGNPELVAKAEADHTYKRQLAGLTMVALMGAGAAMYTAARAFSPKDEQGRNRVAAGDKSAWLRTAKFPISGTKLNVSLAWGFGVGNIANVGAQLAAAGYGDQSWKEAGINSLKTILDIFLPISVSNIDPSLDIKHLVNWVVDTAAPSLLKPLFEYTMNMDSMGNQIYNTRDGKVSGAYSGGPGVPQLLKDVATYSHEHFGTDFEPNEMYHWITNYADSVNDWSNLVYGAKQAFTGEKSMDPKTILGSFISRDRNIDSRDYAEVEGDVKEARKRLNEGKGHPELAAKYHAEHPDDAAIVAKFNNSLSAIRSVQKQIKLTNLSNLTPKEKETKVDELNAKLSLLKRQTINRIRPVKVTP